MNRIASFSVNHDLIVPGIYISRVDGDITTYDLRTRKPNTGDIMDNAAMHSMEHMFATFVRNSALGESIIYFGPMGCQTGFYLLVRNADDANVLTLIKDTLRQILAYDGPVFGASRLECGNYINLSLEKAKTEAARYLEYVKDWTQAQLAYPEEKA
ncbi:MAG: S-ribosylhomocysteine lyase [Clostridia bacterium]|nr:S-ribosylhomocysteine lyase [Clostridia bacterium]